jgi:hypothetical protein
MKTEYCEKADSQSQKQGAAQSYSLYYYCTCQAGPSRSSISVRIPGRERLIDCAACDVVAIILQKGLCLGYGRLESLAKLCCAADVQRMLLVKLLVISTLRNIYSNMGWAPEVGSPGHSAGVSERVRAVEKAGIARIISGRAKLVL